MDYLKSFGWVISFLLGLGIIFGAIPYVLSILFGLTFISIWVPYTIGFSVIYMTIGIKQEFYDKKEK